MKRRLKINGVITFLAVLLIAIFPKIFFRAPRLDSFDEIAEIFGIAFILLGQLFRVSARGYKAEHSRSGSSLIQTGPYALTRNPMYLGILFIGIGIVLMLFKLWVAVIFLAVFSLRYLLLIFKEEKKLSLIFSQEYRAYQKRVPRLIPSMKMLIIKDISEYLPLKLSWLKKEIGSILAVLLIALLVESWEDIRGEGFRTYLKEATGLLIIVILFIGLMFYLSKRTSARGKNV